MTEVDQVGRFNAEKNGVSKLKSTLRDLGLDGQIDAIMSMGFYTVESLISMDEDKLEDVQELLHHEEVPRQVRKRFRQWLREQDAIFSSQPPVGSLSGHFYGLYDCLNDSNASEIEATTILRVDIDHFRTTEQGSFVSKIGIPPGTLDRQLQMAHSRMTPIISLLGPTGVGKSFLCNSFLDRAVPQSKRPVVAKSNQHVPTSAHVCLHRGSTHPGTTMKMPLLLLDFEGEDGRTPRTLIEKGLRKMRSLRDIGVSDEALQVQINSTISARQHVIKEVLPPLAYLLSDLIVFIDTVEPRRTERAERIRYFAEQGHSAVESVGWRPALLLVQNKWTRAVGEEAVADITHEYEWLVESLQGVFSNIIVLRVPAATDTHKFEDSLYVMHQVIATNVQLVQEERARAGCLFSEREFWFAFQSMIRQFNNRRVGQLATSLSEVVSGARVSQNAADNALSALKAFGIIPNCPEEFHRRVEKVLDWYAYARAGHVRSQQTDMSTVGTQSLKALYDRVFEVLMPFEPCCACLHHNGRQHRCTQRRQGHQQEHRRPVMIAVASQNLFKRMLFWKDSRPCVWSEPQGFQALTFNYSFDAFVEAFNAYLQMPGDKYQRAFVHASAWEKKHRLAVTQNDDICSLCLRAGNNQIILPECEHYLCQQCVLTRKMLSGSDDVVCPFCHVQSSLHVGAPDSHGFRVLSLDGGGVRGLIEVLVLQHLEQIFAPLSIRSLFDVIVGTSVGGIISMALLAKVPLARLQEFMQQFAKDILDVHPLQKLYSKVTGAPQCDSDAFDTALRELFQGHQVKGSQISGPPYIFCTAYDTTSNATYLFGTIPDPELHLTRGNIMTQFQTFIAARATSAAPTFFLPVLVQEFEGERYTFKEFADGGITANCPAKVAVKIATELQLTNQSSDDCFIEMLASIGTGLKSPELQVSDGNVLHWAGKLIEFSLDSEKMWRESILDNQAFCDVPKVRINPPHLGSLDAFSSASIPKVATGMADFLQSENGKRDMGNLVNLIYAKMWHVRQDMALVAGERETICITMRDMRCDFDSMSNAELREIVHARNVDSTASIVDNLERNQLLVLAKDSFKKLPFVPPLPGCFGYTFDGEKHILPSTQCDFPLVSKDAGLFAFDVIWRSQVHGDFSISGFPRMMRVLPSSGS